MDISGHNQAKSLVFTRVTVIDITRSSAKSNMTVVVVGNRITDIGESGNIIVPKEAQIVDAAD